MNLLRLQGLKGKKLTTITLAAAAAARTTFAARTRKSERANRPDHNLANGRHLMIGIVVRRHHHFQCIVAPLLLLLLLLLLQIVAAQVVLLLLVAPAVGVARCKCRCYRIIATDSMIH